MNALYGLVDIQEARGKTKSSQKKLGTLALAALTFFSVSGGPYGMEEVPYILCV